jgi:hypothetical protein
MGIQSFDKLPNEAGKMKNVYNLKKKWDWLYSLDEYVILVLIKMGLQIAALLRCSTVIENKCSISNFFATYHNDMSHVKNPNTEK